MSDDELVRNLVVQLTAAAGENKRRHPRLPLGLAAHCQLDGVVSQEALGDLSASGLYLRTTSELRTGTRIRIVLGLPYIGGQRVCTLSGQIVWVDRGSEGAVRGAGVEFDESDSNDLDLLRGFLALWGAD